MKVQWPLNPLYIFGLHGDGYAHDAVKHDYETAVALAADTAECPAHTVKGAAVDADVLAGGKPDFGGREIDGVGTLGRCHGYEVGHAVVGDDDRIAVSVAPFDEIVQIGEGVLGRPDAVGGSARKEQVVHGRNYLTALAAADDAHDMTHGDECLDAPRVQFGLSLQGAIIHGAHGPPVYCLFRLLHVNRISFVAKWYILSSLFFL